MDLNEVAADIATLSAFGKASQLHRLLRLDFPFDDGPEKGTLLVNTMHAREELSRDFRIDLELLSDCAFIPLNTMMAKMVTVSLVRADGSLRYFNGYVNEFELLKTDGGFAFYRMVLGPWLALGGEPFPVTESVTGAASAVLVTRCSAGATASQRREKLALPPNNSAEVESPVTLS